MEIAEVSGGNAIPTIETEEELNNLLNPEGKKDLDEEDEEGEEKPDLKKTQEEKKEQKSVFNQEKDETGDDDEEEKGKDDNSQYRNMLEYLNDKHSLNLNVESLPEDLTREQEAEVLSSVIERMTQGVNDSLAQYRHLDELTRNPEVVHVLNALMEGKSLKDVAKEYQTTTEGMDSEALVFSDFKKRYPSLKDEVVRKMVDGTKQSGEFETIVQSIREYRQSEELQSAMQEEQLMKDQKVQVERQRQEEIKQFQSKLTSVKNVFGVPVDDQMRAEIFAASTQRNEQGLTYLDEALQTDEGIMLATLGLLHLEKLVTAKASVKANKRNKTFIDKLYDDPGRLQSGSAKGHEEGYDVDLVNRF